MGKEQTKSDLWTDIKNLFASIKLTVVLLTLLAATSILGTLIPQGAEASAYVNAYGEFTYRLLNFFDLLNMYHSWWFKTLIFLLAANIIVCTFNRWPVIWRMVSSRNLRFDSIGKQQPLFKFSDSREYSNLECKYQSYIKNKFAAHSVETNEKGFRIAAERGRWSRLGIPIVHLSIVVILMGALVGSFGGFDGFVNIPEGGSADHIQLRNRTMRGLGFEVRCDDFDVSFYDTGVPKEFRSSLVILESGQEVAKKDIIVNDPLRYKGINFFQSSYGRMPPRTIEITFTSNSTGEFIREHLSLGQSLDLPDQGGRFTVRQISHDYRFMDTQLGEAVIATLEKPGRQPQEIALPFRMPTFDRMRKGEWFISVVGFESPYYTGLQVTKDPGVPLVYAGFILLIAGCCIAFFVSHQKMMISVQSGSPKSHIQIFGSASRNRIGFEMTVRKMAAKLQQL